jgi:hypothetical protein
VLPHLYCFSHHPTISTINSDCLNIASTKTQFADNFLTSNAVKPTKAEHNGTNNPN